MKKLICTLLSLGVLFSVNVSGGAEMKNEKRYIREVGVHDPSIIKDTDGSYYVFGTHITTAKSNNLIDWDYTARGYKREGNVHFGNLSENLKGSFKWAGEDDSDCKGGFAVWAPDVFYNPRYCWPDGTTGAYMMYYSASSTYKRSCIGLAVSRDIDGVYEYVDTIIYSGFTKVKAKDENSTHNKIYTNTNIDELIEKGRVCSYKDDWGIDDYNNITYPNAIDPCVYMDARGRMYLTYGSWSGGIFALRINELNGLPVYPGFDKKTADGRMVDRYFGTHIAGGKGWSGEGPFVYYDKETEYFYLQTSYEWLGTDGGYHIRLFRSRDPFGPFTDAVGNNAVYGDIHHEHGIKLFGNYRFENMTAYTSGGHSSALVDDDGERYLFYHTRFKGTEAFQMRVHQMFLNREGWPVVAPMRYMGSKIKDEGYSDDEIVGIYEYINHGRYIAEGSWVRESQTVRLTSDGKIVGAVEGSWEKDGKYATMKIDGKIYEGVFFKQLTETGEEEVMTFSLIGENNEAVWGVKRDTSEYSIKGEVFTLNEDNAFIATREKGKNPKADMTKKIELTNGSIALDGKTGIMLDAKPSYNMTISFWMNSGEIMAYTPIVTMSDDFVSEKQNWFSLTNFGGKEAVLWSRNAERDQWLEGRWKKSYKADARQHVTIVFSDKYYGGSEDCITAKLYIDGMCVATGSVTKAMFTDECKIYLGINPWDSGFEGTIEDLKIFERPFSHVDVFSLYNASCKTE